MLVSALESAHCQSAACAVDALEAVQALCRSDKARLALASRRVAELTAHLTHGAQPGVRRCRLEACIALFGDTQIADDETFFEAFQDDDDGAPSARLAVARTTEVASAVSCVNLAADFAVYVHTSAGTEPILFVSTSFYSKLDLKRLYGRTTCSMRSSTF